MKHSQLICMGIGCLILICPKLFVLWFVTVTWLQISVAAVTTSICFVVPVSLRGQWHSEKIHRNALFAGMTVNFSTFQFCSSYITVSNAVIIITILTVFVKMKTISHFNGHFPFNPEEFVLASTPQSSSAYTHTQRHNHLTALCPRLPGWAGTRINIHPLTSILVIRRPLSTTSVYYYT